MQKHLVDQEHALGVHIPGSGSDVELSVLGERAEFICGNPFPLN